MADFCRDEGDFPGSVVDDVRDYFARSSWIRSLASIPVFESASDEAVCIGVINIHSDRPEMLRRDSNDQFLNLLGPFRVLLAHLMQVQTFPRGIAALGVDASPSPAE